MDLRTLGLCFAAVVLAATSFIYGWKFFKKRNYLLAVEWFVMGTSSSNATYFFATGNQQSYAVAHFFDAFSRAFGLPVIGVLGLMAITHGFRPSIRFDVGAFVVSAIATLVLVTARFVERPLPYFYLVMIAIFCVYLVYFALRLFRAGNWLNGASVLLATVSSGAIAGIYDFYKIPGEETNVFLNFFFMALLTWAYLMVSLYYAYCALESAKSDARREDGRPVAGAFGRTRG